MANKKTTTDNEEYMDYLAEAFCTEAKKENDKLAIAAFVAGATVWGLSGNMIAGLALGGCILLHSDRSIRASNRALHAIEKTRLAAPFLTPDRFQDFKKQFGEPLALEQLQEAHEYGLPIQAAAEDFLFKQRPDLLKPSLPKLALPGSQRAVTVIDLAEKMGQTLKPTIISAMPRSGKGILIANAWRSAKRHHPDLKVYVIDPKAHPDESGYWDGCDRVLAIRFDQIDVNCAATISALEAFIQEWRDDPATEKLLIFDEQIAVKAKLPKWYREHLVPMIQSEGSAGETFKRYLWLVMQSPLASDVGLSGGSRSIYIHCALATNISEEGMNPKAWMNSAKSSGFIPSIPSAEQFEASPRGTLCYTSLIGEWVALPEYPVPPPRSLTPPPKLTSQPPQIPPNLVQPIQPAQPQETHVVNQQLEKPVELVAATSELTNKVKALSSTLKSQFLEIKPAIAQLIKDGREDLIFIASLSAEKGEITARMVRERMKRKPWYKALESASKALDVSSNHATRSLFSELSDRGIGDCFGEGDRQTFLLFRGDDRVLTGDAGDGNEE